MTRAEIAAWEAYPDDRFVDAEYSSMCRGFYQEGYEQAEKDLALTQEDMKLIDELITEMAFSEPNDSMEWYQELANRFNEKRKK